MTEGQIHPAAMVYSVHYGPIPDPPLGEIAARKLLVQGWWLRLLGEPGAHMRVRDGEVQIRNGGDTKWQETDIDSWYFGCSDFENPRPGEFIVVRPDE